MRPLLVVMNPRRIPACLASYEKLTIDVAYARGYTELQLVPVIAEIVESTGHSHLLVVSDDVIVSQAAVDAVLAGLHAGAAPVVTGWCNLDATDARVNLTKRPLEGDEPRRD